MAWYDKMKEFSEIIVDLDEKIGFKRLLLYVILILCVIGVFNFRSVVKSSIELISEINEEIHNEKMEKRDELLRDLSPILQEFRTVINADRVLYFEYHNSKENLVGIPFKYIDLVLQNSKYGISVSPEANLKDINVGMITNLYEDIKLGDIVFCQCSSDSIFQQRYQGTFNLFHEADGSNKLAVLSIPGVRQPVGMIVFEWLDESADIREDDVIKFAHGNNSYISRINGLIMSKR